MNNILKSINFYCDKKKHDHLETDQYFIYYKYESGSELNLVSSTNWTNLLEHGQSGLRLVDLKSKQQALKIRFLKLPSEEKKIGIHWRDKRQE